MIDWSIKTYLAIIQFDFFVSLDVGTDERKATEDNTAKDNKEQTDVKHADVSTDEKKATEDNTAEDNKEHLDDKPEDTTVNQVDDRKGDYVAPVPDSLGGTVKPTSNFYADTDADEIKQALQGWGTDEAPLIKILAGRSNAQRQEVKQAYQAKYNQELLEALKSELSGDFEEVIMGLLYPPVEYDAFCLHSAVEGYGTNEAVLIGIICTRSDEDLNNIMETYKKNYGSDLVADIEGDTSGEFQKLLVQLIKTTRDKSNTIDAKLAKKDAQALYNGGETVMDLQSGGFREIMCARNPAQLRAMFDQYKKLAKQDISEGIKEAMAGDDEAAYIALVQAINDPIEFYVSHIHDAVKGMGTRDTQLMRLIVARSEIDLADIKLKYHQMYGMTLEEILESECSGPYKNMLLALIRDK